MIEDMRVRNLARQTEIAYVTQVARFAKHFWQVAGATRSGGDPNLTKSTSSNEKHVSWSLLNQTVCGLRFLYRVTLRREWAIEHIPYPRQERKLPVALSLAEVATVFRSRCQHQAPRHSHDRLCRQDCGLQRS